MEKLMDTLMKAKDWIMARCSERTSWDGVTIIGVSILVLLGVPVVKLLAWPALLYGVFTFFKEEGVI
jgi:hypothetical protein|tara:strand:+ start:1286 stop:1486 length:201 start_codon:yes stop_codon:yes gene_type:complete